MEKRFQDQDEWKKFKHKFKDQLLIYIQELYNKKSKLNQIEDLGLRKIEACKKASMDFRLQDVKDIMNMQDDVVNKIIFYYLSYFQNSNKCQKLMSDQQLFWSMQQVLNKPLDFEDPSIDAKIKSLSNISEESDKLLARMDRGFSELYGDDGTIEMAEEQLRKLMSPEQRLKKKNA